MDVFRSYLQLNGRTAWEREKEHGRAVAFCGDLVDGVVEVALQVAR
jgi:hypothetical protein